MQDKTDVQTAHSRLHSHKLIGNWRLASQTNLLNSLAWLLCSDEGLSAFALSKTVSSSANWYLADRITDLSKSSGSPLSLVSPSASICPVGHHLGSRLARMTLWRMMATSIAVLLSSNVPPLPSEIKWSYSDRQSVIPIMDLLFNTSRDSSKRNGPSKHSASKSWDHSAIPDAVAKACASPDNVEATPLGSLYDFQLMQCTGTSSPWLIRLDVKLSNQPPRVLKSSVFAKAASDQWDVRHSHLQTTLLRTSTNSLIGRKEMLHCRVRKRLLRHGGLYCQVWSTLRRDPTQCPIYGSKCWDLFFSGWQPKFLHTLFGNTDWMDMFGILILVVNNLSIVHLLIEGSQKLSLSSPSFSEGESISQKLNSRFIFGSRPSCDGVVRLHTKNTLKLSVTTMAEIQTVIQFGTSEPCLQSNSIKFHIPIVRCVVGPIYVSQGLYQTALRNFRNSTWRELSVPWFLWSLFGNIGFKKALLISPRFNCQRWLTMSCKIGEWQCPDRTFSTRSGSWWPLRHHRAFVRLELSSR